MEKDENIWTELQDKQLDDIKKHLQIGAEVYQSGNNLTSEPDGGRSGIMISLNATLDLLELLNLDSGRQKPLNRLLSALKDLDQGSVAKFLEPNRDNRGRPSPVYEDYLFRVLAVTIMILLQQDEGVSQVEAAKLAVRLLKKEGFQLSPKPDTSETGALINWKKALETNPCKERSENTIMALEKFPESGEKKARCLAGQIKGIFPQSKYLIKAPEKDSYTDDTN